MADDLWARRLPAPRIRPTLEDDGPPAHGLGAKIAGLTQRVHAGFYDAMCYEFVAPDVGGPISA
jgi:hypothetical protein